MTGVQTCALPIFAGEDVGHEKQPDHFMLLSASAQRQKSWSCEHCQNFLKFKKAEICRECYWANADNYTHIAMEQHRRIDLVWKQNEVKIYDSAKKNADSANLSLHDYLKKIVSEKQKQFTK